MTTVAVTGSEGFIASHLVELLVHGGCSVRAMVQYNSSASWGRLDIGRPDDYDRANRELAQLKLTLLPGR